MSICELAVMDHTGDSKIEWDPNKPDEVAAARSMFNSLKDKRYRAYKLDRKGASTGEIIRDFDPKAERIIMSPQTVGG